MSERKLFAVIGRPVLHSRSPDLFAAAFSQMGFGADYTRIIADTASQAVEIAREIGVSGFNVTAPFKEEVLEHVDSLDDVCGHVGAANTIVAEDGLLHAHNTDWIGVLKALRNNECDPLGKKAVVLGAGGAGRAAAWGLLRGGARDVIIANRSEERARTAARNLGCMACSLNEVGSALDDADILVSCLPAGVTCVRPEWLRRELCVLEANYSRPLLSESSRAAGCRVIDGHEWLVWQALAGLNLFTHRECEKSVMEKSLLAARGWQNIALVGFMGSGKSTLGRLLAENLNMRFVDCDNEVERRSGRKIFEMFKEQRDYGQSNFRCLEKEVIKQAVSDEGAVLALGGGALLDEQNLKLIGLRSLVIWLWTSLPTALARAGDGTRPLLEGYSAYGEPGKLLSARLPGYTAAADLVVGTKFGNPENLARKIENEIRQAVQS